MPDRDELAEATDKILEEMLGPFVCIDGLEKETDENKVSGIVFELYKEAATVVNLVAHLLDEATSAKGGWPRNQAICAGLMVRITKFMVVVTQLSAKGDRSEVVMALSRCIMESAINLEFLVHKNEDRFYDQFVKLSLGPERELYDLIQRNVAARNGQTWPIEGRMLKRIDDLCRVSGVKIEDIDRKPGDWGGGVRERLKSLGKEDSYVSMQRTPSHAVHGTWVDLYNNHLEYNDKTGTYVPEPRFSWIDARALGPIAVLVLDAVRPYLDRFFSDASSFRTLRARLDDVQRRLLIADDIHEQLYAKSWQKAP
ncbi:MAG: DUF5677 domain-containing protein [Candidatus Sulfotelmatobacter sp.]|jgi:hypothetical protein